jgi:hypothetical protein
MQIKIRSISLFLIGIMCFFLLFTSNSSALSLADVYPTTTPTDNELTMGWWAPELPVNSGYYDFSVGVHFWTDHTEFRNAQIRYWHNLWPGLRINTVTRSNRRPKDIAEVDLSMDEVYMEQYGYWTGESSRLSVSTKMGRMRYLRFPYPDIISMYDQVPGIEDLQGRFPTAYQGVLLTQEWAHESGFGWHLSNLIAMDSPRQGASTIENYAFFRWNWRFVDFEGRLGRLAGRNAPLGHGDLGASYYMGSTWRGYKVGFLFESLETEGIRTGLLVQFAPSMVTNLLGTLHADYTRTNEGFAIQPRLLHGYFGMTESHPKKGLQVGAILAERSITYWQDGQGRNSYEHIITKWGQTSGDDLIVVADEAPQYLKIESLVSQVHIFNKLDDFRRWEAQRQGPAQLAQPVIYRYYKKGE